MRAFERRAADAYPFFKVDVWDEAIGSWRASRTIYETRLAAIASTRIKKSGRYRIVAFAEYGKQEMELVDVKR